MAAHLNAAIDLALDQGPEALATWFEAVHAWNPSDEIEKAIKILALAGCDAVLVHIMKKGINDIAKALIAQIPPPQPPVSKN